MLVVSECLQGRSFVPVLTPVHPAKRGCIPAATPAKLIEIVVQR